MKSAKERKQAERGRRKADGQVYVQEWVKIEDVAALKRFAAELRNRWASASTGH